MYLIYLDLKIMVGYLVSEMAVSDHVEVADDQVMPGYSECLDMRCC